MLNPPVLGGLLSSIFASQLDTAVAIPKDFHILTKVILNLAIEDVAQSLAKYFLAGVDESVDLCDPNLLAIGLLAGIESKVLQDHITWPVQFFAIVLQVLDSRFKESIVAITGAGHVGREIWAVAPEPLQDVV